MRHRYWVTGFQGDATSVSDKTLEALLNLKAVYYERTVLLDGWFTHFFIATPASATGTK